MMAKFVRFQPEVAERILLFLRPSWLKETLSLCFAAWREPWFVRKMYKFARVHSRTPATVIGDDALGNRVYVVRASYEGNGMLMVDQHMVLPKQRPAHTPEGASLTPRRDTGALADLAVSRISIWQIYGSNSQ